MSQSHNIGTGGSATDRPRRNIKQTQKLTELHDAGETVPGFVNQGDNSTPTYPAPSSVPNMPPLAATPKARSNMSSGQNTPVTNDPDITVPSFKPNTFAIYFWEVPRPTDFINLSKSRKAWKQRTDAQEKARDIDDGSDDWYEFSGVRSDYSTLGSHRGGFEMEFAIATSFKIRAKRAFWAGKTWKDFELRERSINSEAKAKAEPDPARRALLLENALDNKLRLAVFEALKQRLCEEIWLQKHQDHGLVKLQVPGGPRRDSAMPTGALLSADPASEVQRRVPTVEELEQGIVAWSLDGHGAWQPLYQGEIQTPSGMRNFMTEMREQERREANQRSQLGIDVHGGQVTSPGGHTQRRVSAQYGAGSDFRRELDFSDSDEGEK